MYAALLDSEYVLLRVVTNSLREAKRPKKGKESLERQMLSNTPFGTFNLQFIRSQHYHS